MGALSAEGARDDRVATKRRQVNCAGRTEHFRLAEPLDTAYPCFGRRLADRLPGRYPVGFAPRSPGGSPLAGLATVW